jgi:hypothetical protein
MSARYRDKDVLAGQVHWHDRSSLQDTVSPALLKYFALLLRFHPLRWATSWADAADAGKNNDTVNYDDMEPWTRVSPRLRPTSAMGLAATTAPVRSCSTTSWPESPYRPVAGDSRDERAARRACHRRNATANRTEHGDRFHLERPGHRGQMPARQGDDGDFSRQGV